MPANKVRRRGSYAPLSAHYYKDDALLRAGEKAEVLYARGLAFCSEVLSDGLITDAQLQVIGIGLSGLAGRARKLVEVGVWLREDGGYRVRSWLDWNQSRAEILDAAERDAARKGGASASRPEPPPGGDVPDSARNPTGQPRNPGGTRAESQRLAHAPARASSRSSTRSSSTSTDSCGIRTGPQTARDRAAALVETAHTGQAHRLVNAYAETCRRRPPTRVLSDLAVQVDGLLAEQWIPSELGPVLAAWGAKGLHPSTLPSVAHEVANSSPATARPRPSTADAAVAAVEALRTGTDGPTLRALPGGHS